MCFFPIPNFQFNGPAYQAGVKYFECGSCPECLQKRSSVWALRSVAECESHAHNIMVTLTYDSFRYNAHGVCIGENPVDPTIKVCKRHIQLFIKRLRKWCASHNLESPKYLCGAEYGSRTHRAHYHLILFGIDFPDSVLYKKSKRGNPIYWSDTLVRLWGHGICTVDSRNVRSACARYCTKYTAKSRSDETFMLFSHNIGVSKLLADFNGRSYYVDGREHPVPRLVWQRYLSAKYKGSPIAFDYRYKNFRRKKFTYLTDDEDYMRSKELRAAYRALRDNDPEYQRYLAYWKHRGELYARMRLPLLQRINLLDESKYHFYKTLALRTKNQHDIGIYAPPPGSRAFSVYRRCLEERFGVSYTRSGQLDFSSFFRRMVNSRYICRLSTCLKTANDTNSTQLEAQIYQYRCLRRLQHALYDEQLTFFLRKHKKKT